MDLRKVFGAELEQVASPLTDRVDDVIARIKRIEALLASIDERLKQLQPLVDLLKKFRLI
jgi:chaperonin cofactor prefoldin